MKIQTFAKLILAAVLLTGVSASAVAAQPRKGTKRKTTSVAAQNGTITNKTLEKLLEDHEIRTITSTDVLLSEIKWADGITSRIIKTYRAQNPSKRNLSDAACLVAYQSSFSNFMFGKARYQMEMNYAASISLAYDKMCTYYLYGKLISLAADDAQKKEVCNAILCGEAMNGNNALMAAGYCGLEVYGGTMGPSIEQVAYSSVVQSWNRMLEKYMDIFKGESVKSSISIPQGMTILNGYTDAREAEFKEVYQDSLWDVATVVSGLTEMKEKMPVLTETWLKASARIFPDDAARAASMTNATADYIAGVADTMKPTEY